MQTVVSCDNHFALSKRVPASWSQRPLACLAAPLVEPVPGIRH